MTTTHGNNSHDANVLEKQCSSVHLFIDKVTYQEVIDMAFCLHDARSVVAKLGQQREIKNFQLGMRRSYVRLLSPSVRTLMVDYFLLSRRVRNVKVMTIHDYAQGSF